jgi:hypothetical protein
MKNIDTKTWVIIALSVLVVIFGWIAFKTEPPPYDIGLINSQVKAKEIENALLKESLASEKLLRIKLFQQNDSLGNLKPKIEYRYVTKTNEIDNASVGDVVNDFQSVFTKDNIK